MSGKSKKKLGIIAGGGTLPLKLARACADQERDYFILAMEGAADVAAIETHPHATVSLGSVGEALNYLKSSSVCDVVMAGNIKRPSMSSLKLDSTGAKLMGRLGFKLFGGDDAILKVLVDFLEEEGFNVVGADDVLGGLLAPEGELTTAKPDTRQREDIDAGKRTVKTLGELDIGQAVIVEHGYVLGVEAAEGTDALIHRCKELQREEKRAVLVKMKKPGQEERTDLPTIGPHTIRSLHEAGMAGVAIEAGGSLLLEKEETLELANTLGIFVIAI